MATPLYFTTAHGEPTTPYIEGMKQAARDALRAARWNRQQGHRELAARFLNGSMECYRLAVDAWFFS